MLISELDNYFVKPFEKKLYVNNEVQEDTTLMNARGCQL
jgi:hypothetical protein